MRFLILTILLSFPLSAQSLPLRPTVPTFSELGMLASSLQSGPKLTAGQVINDKTELENLLEYMDRMSYEDRMLKLQIGAFLSVPRTASCLRQLTLPFKKHPVRFFWGRIQRGGNAFMLSISIKE